MYIRRLSSSLTLECHTAASQENIRRKHCFVKIRQPSYFLSREDLAGIIAAIEGTIGDGFEHVLLLDVLCAFQIGYRARDFNIRSYARAEKPNLVIVNSNNLSESALVHSTRSLIF